MVCSKCGYGLREGLEVCPCCNEVIQPKKKFGGKIFGLLLFLIGLSLIGYGAFLSSKNNVKQEVLQDSSEIVSDTVLPDDEEVVGGTGDIVLSDEESKNKESSISLNCTKSDDSDEIKMNYELNAIATSTGVLNKVSMNVSLNFPNTPEARLVEYAKQFLSCEKDFNDDTYLSCTENVVGDNYIISLELNPAKSGNSIDDIKTNLSGDGYTCINK